ncbi:LOW QUALITY PROTEIN: C2 domain-containing protein 3 [Xyrichtys novacula]|uniref:LOW QUALITY PROTEIN: C2 domain-containing protein 3 n=1 Tax=Xyrichtys novacula TaxID=13765 RepID=A0AAV1FVZ8_XYRNO|nr:LOW QUALITY PROTEIN: C2 domain-containing protein 3 [Xyrichtys novacula]
MKSRKLKSVKAGGSKKKVPSDVSPSTSLPPLVEGQLRCFLRVTVSRVLWTVHKPPSATFIRLRWWGESSTGTHFLPRDGSQLSQRTIKTTARFPIRCGPKQFTSYLTDMGSLVLEALTKPDHLPVARAQVAGISRLSLSHSISGFYTLVSPTSEKLGELQVSLSLEPLTEAYDSSSSCPATDISTEVPQATTLTVPSQPRTLSAESSGRNTPRGRDHLYFQNEQTLKGKGESLENKIPGTSRSQNSHSAVNLSSQEPRGQTTSDILSVILERGNKLRNAMVESAFSCNTDPALALKDAPLPLPKDNILPPPNRPSPSPSGMFLQNILHADSALKHSEDAAAVKDCGLDCPADVDSRAVELLLGSLNTSPLPLWDGEGSSPESLSDHDSVCGDSELNDPQYDQSLLENLFYKTPISDMTSDGPDVGDRGTAPSSRKGPKQPEPQSGGRPHSDLQQSADAAGVPPGLSSEQMTLLHLIRLAKVTIDSLNVPTGSTNTTPRKASSKGRPPRPLTSKKCTYFIEYVFPRASTSSRHDRRKSGEGEVTRAVASKVAGGVVKFHQHTVFPVHLSTAAVKQWWETDLVFKIHSRRSDQKKPVPIGKAVHPLRCLLGSKQLSQSVILPVQSVEGSSGVQEVGPLKVTLELATDNKDFSSQKHQIKLAQRDASPSQTVPSPQRESSSRPQQADLRRDELADGSFEESRLNVWSPQKSSKDPSLHPGLHTPPHKPYQQQEEEDPEILLHTLLMVPDGKNLNCGPGQAPNIYLNCKLFCCDETARSVISWGQTNPSFNFVQVTPVALTSKLLERMKNNVMVIEVWQKTGSSGQDRLLGLVKLPLHQFYMSFRDPKITHLLLQAQYPVLGVDCYMPVVDVFSGTCRGHLRVVLALGHSEQIVAFQRTRDEDYGSLSHAVRPVHLLDHKPRSQTKVTHSLSMREHLFVIRVEKVNGLTPLQSTVWGEADCYVQYNFPCQEGDPAANLDQDLIESSLNLKEFRTTTTLCIPDPVFGHTETHVLLAPDGVPAQKLLLSSLSSQGLGGGGGVQFEVWCRYYYPNVRDQLVAKGLLPLSKLCAMVTMQRQHPDETQMFSLPLIPRTDSPSGYRPQPSGLLDVCVRYKHRPVRPEGLTVQGAAARVVTLVVQVHRASGLQAAAKVLSEQDERLGYFAGVGVNSYVTVQLSFLPESERRSTRVAARSFCPEFDHHMEVSCNLLVQRSSGETCSLAEQLEEASAVFTVWNKDNRKGITLTQKPKDVMLGTLKIPLTDLIKKRTGISGWFGLYVPQETSSSQHILVGGLEISINFAHHSDRERVIKSAQGVGWDVSCSETQDDEDDESSSPRKMSLTFSLPRAWIPIHCLLLPGHSELQRSTYCYFRYKFYDQEAFCSHMRHPSVEEEGQATVTFQGSRTVELRRTQPLMWYLREERLEVQVWVAFKKDKSQRPRDTDRLVGSAFVDLSSLAKTAKQKLTLSGVYPLFRRSAADLQGAALRVHVTLTVDAVPAEVPAEFDTQVDSDSQEELLEEEAEAANQTPSPASPKKTFTQSKHKHKPTRTTPDITSVQHAGTSLDESFPVTVTVDRAMHLNLGGCPLTERSGGTPCCCVSYLTADSDEPASTAVIADSDCPVWDHQHECRLSKQLLVDPQQSLVFKVWHKGETERVLGFASVDLSPLLCGFQSLCGWYNITDFSGQCHGQLKVSVTPLKGVQDLRAQRKAVSEETVANSAAVFPALPLSYHTTATYSSFPAHISRYTEQKISSPDHTDRLFSERSSESERHFEHMDKVRLYHQSLQEKTANSSVCSSSAADVNPSSSFLLSTLRRKLSELDNIQRYFSRKLSTPTFPPMMEQDVHSQNEEEEEERDEETDSSQLLLKSKQLVGEVNNIISGLREHSLDQVSSHPQRSSTSAPVTDNNLQTIPESVSGLSRRASHSSLDDVLGLLTPLPRTPEDKSGSECEEEKDSRDSEASVSERENIDGSDEDRTHHRRDEEADNVGEEEEEEEEEEEDGDYEEEVVKPRPLNEMTSLTDKTSPWTSVLSDPDLVSLQSLEVSEESDQSQEEEEKWQRVNRQTGGCCAKVECARGEERGQSGGSCNGSAGDGSDSDRDDERTSQNLHEIGEEPDSSEEKSPSQPITDTHEAGDAQDSEETVPKPSVPVEVPNFFLPSQQLEASMRAIRLAPSFSHSSTDPGSSSRSHRHGPRRRPNMSPSSMRKETERIAKIFAAHFDNA